MSEYQTFIDLAQTAPLLAVLFFLWKSGFIKIGKNGKVNGIQGEINMLKDHAEIANKEMGFIKKSISCIEKDVAFIKGKLSAKD